MSNLRSPILLFLFIYSLGHPLASMGAANNQIRNELDYLLENMRVTTEKVNHIEEVEDTISTGQSAVRRTKKAQTTNQEASKLIQELESEMIQKPKKLRLFKFPAKTGTYKRTRSR